MSLKRRSFLAASVAAAAFQTPAIHSSNHKAQRNVLLIISDDHSFESGAYGNKIIDTPSIDRMAEKGVRFTNNFCTTPSCSASRSVIFTGLYNHANGQFGHAHSYNHFSLHEWVKPVHTLLHESGYKTGLIGKFHVNTPSHFKLDYVDTKNSRHVKQMSDKAADFFAQTKGNPFFLTVGYSDPHRAGKGFGEDKVFPGVENKTYSPEEVIVPDFLPDTPATRDELAKYYSSIHRMDQGIGFLLDALEKDGRLNDTLIIYISDNGMAFPGAKSCLYDPGINLPMIVMSPTLEKPGGVTHAMTNYTDLVPTILDWTGAKPPEYDLHGRSFLPVLNEQNPNGWDEINFSHTFHEITMYYPSRGTRTKKYKYINNLAHEMIFPFASDLYASKTWQYILKNEESYFGARTVENYLYRDEEELYDLEQDPNEIHNLANNPRYRNVLTELKQQTMDFRRRTKDPWLIGEPGMNPDKQYPDGNIKL